MRVKLAEIRFLGVASYAAAVLSTVVLVLAGYADATLSLVLSCGLIVAGALVATLTPQRVAA